MNPINKESLANSQATKVVANPNNSFISINVANNGRFNSGSTIPQNSYNISYNWPNTPFSSYTTIRIDGVDYIYGECGTQIQAPTDVSSTLNVSEWRYNDVSIKQYLEIVENPFTGREDMGRYRYEIKNLGTCNRSIGLRIMIDTMVNNNNRPSIVLPNSTIITNETEFNNSNIPEYINAYFDYPTDLNTASLAILKGQTSQVNPDRVIFANWANLYNNPWNYVPSTSPTGDNAYAVYWLETNLDPNESITRFTYYGLASQTGIPFTDEINVQESSTTCTLNTNSAIDVTAQSKIFANKFAFSEADCSLGSVLGRGDRLGFNLIFGNYGDLDYVASASSNTVIDTLTIESPARMILLSLSMPEEFMLFNLTTGNPISIGDIFETGTTSIQVRRLISGGDPTNPDDFLADFDLEAQSVYSIAMLFEVSFN